MDKFPSFAPQAIAIPRKHTFLDRYLLKTLHALGALRFLDYPAAMNGAASPLAPNVGPSIASAASLANSIVAFITPVTGTNAMTGFRLPRGFRGVFCIIPTAAANGTTGGTLAYSADGTTEDIPFGVGWTGAANKALFFITDGAKCYPSVLTAAG